MENDPRYTPISYLHGPTLLGEDDGRILAANSCDCILRVYECRSKLIRIALGHDRERMYLARTSTGSSSVSATE
jgi:hypothetical protein